MNNLQVFQLITLAKEHLRQYPLPFPADNFPRLFRSGAYWMLRQLNALDGGERKFDTKRAYELYGYGKYALCLSGAGLSLLFFWQYAIPLIPLSVLVFYLLEVQLLFLFPLLLDGTNNPIKTSIRLTRRVGVWQAVGNVLVLGVYMLVGLFHIRAPLRNWYVGCLVVLIWYNQIRHEH